MITCRELIDFLDRYVDDELSPKQRRSFEFHLRLCADCRNYLDSYRKTIRLGRLAMTGEDAQRPADVPEGLIKAILAARE